MPPTSLLQDGALGARSIAALGTVLGSLSALALTCSLIVLGVMVVGLIQETRRRALRYPATVPGAVPLSRTLAKRAA